MAKITAFHHPALCVPKSKFQEVVEFYQDVMGYTVYYIGDERGSHFGLLKLYDGTWLEIEDYSETLGELEDGQPAVFENMAYIVDDMQEFLDQAAEKGCRILFGPLEAKFAEETDVYVGYLTLPSGETIALLQYR